MKLISTPEELRSRVPADADLSHILPDLRPLAVPVKSLLSDPRNARKHNPRNLETVRASIASYSQRKPVVVNSRTMIVTAGNGTLEVFRQAGLEYIAAAFSEDDAVTATGYGLADNRSAELAEWDDDVLGSLLRDMQAEQMDVGMLGWSDEDMALLLSGGGVPVGEGSGGAEGGGDDPTPIDKAAELQKVWQTERGQIWEIPSKSVPGKCHRVMCGDCRDPSDVEALLDGQKVNVAFTSPPYASQRKYDEESGFLPIKPDAYVEWFEAVQANVRRHLAPDGSWFVNIKEHCEDGQRHLYVKDLTIAHVRLWAWRFVDELCWRDTKNGTPGFFPNRFKDAWEPVFHYATQSKIAFNAESVGSVSMQCFDYDEGTERNRDKAGMKTGKPPSGYKSGVARPSNVLDIPAGSSDGVGSLHQAGFPVALPAFFIKAYSDLGDVIFDPFLGSGTTMIAAEREGRIGYGMELSPKYVAVILERAKSAGLKPRLI